MTDVRFTSTSRFDPTLDSHAAPALGRHRARSRPHFSAAVMTLVFLIGIALGWAL
jgi:hypothetical protein